MTLFAKKSVAFACSLLIVVCCLGFDSAYAAGADRTVYVSSSGTYHYVSNCSGMKKYVEKTLVEAQQAGNVPCKNCVVEGGGSVLGDGGQKPSVEYYLFDDTPVDAWYVRQGALDYVVSNGIMTGLKTNGVLNGTFGPDDSITRGQVATILYRMAGEPDAAVSEMPFGDVDAARYYAHAIGWAYENDIVSGYKKDGVFTGEFGPDDGVTREQLATMIGRYAIFSTGGIGGGWDEATSIAGWDETSAYARPYVAWVVGAGIMTGKKQSDGSYYLAPAAGATRAEMAKMVMVLDRDVLS